MTKTYSLSTIQTATLAFLFVMIASLAFAMPASADVSGATQDHPGGYSSNSTASKDAGGKKTGGDGGSQGCESRSNAGTASGCKSAKAPASPASSECRTVPTNTGGSTTKCDKAPLQQTLEQRLADLKAKIDDLMKKKDELMTVIGSRASSTGTGAGTGDWRDRLCKSGGSLSNIAIPGGVRERLCDKDNHGTTTPKGPGDNERCKSPNTSSSTQRMCDKKHATTTPIFKVMRPNDGTIYSRRNDKSVLIQWRDTAGIETVDIDLKQGATTTSIAKDVKGKKGNGNFGSVLGAMSSGTSNAGGGGGGSDMNKSGRGEESRQENVKVLSYRWKDAPVGEGYKIVITGKKDGTTYTDESDSTFSVKQSPRGLDFLKHERNDGHGGGDNATGNVLGAETVSAEVLDAQLDDMLGELAMALATL